MEAVRGGGAQEGTLACGPNVRIAQPPGIPVRHSNVAMYNLVLRCRLAAQPYSYQFATPTRDIVLEVGLDLVHHPPLLQQGKWRQRQQVGWHPGQARQRQRQRLPNLHRPAQHRLTQQAAASQQHRQLLTVSPVTRLKAAPLRPNRPERPMRCRYVSNAGVCRGMDGGK